MCAARQDEVEGRGGEGEKEERVSARARLRLRSRAAPRGRPDEWQALAERPCTVGGTGIGAGRSTSARGGREGGKGAGELTLCLA